MLYVGEALNVTNLVIASTGTIYRTVAINAVKAGLIAMRDIEALNGMVPGWNWTCTAGNATTTGGITSAACKSVESGGTDWLRYGSITWITHTNVTQGSNLSSAALQYSTNSTNGTDGAWSDLNDSGTLNLCTFTYDADGNLESTAWS